MMVFFAMVVVAFAVVVVVFTVVVVVFTVVVVVVVRCVGFTAVVFMRRGELQSARTDHAHDSQGQHCRDSG
jgi:UPF0716 family protein affecting phage T7 exclusion